MDSIIEMTRELAYELQSDQRFIRTQLARSQADDDAELQGLIGEFNLKRATLSTVMSKEDKDKDRLQELNNELRDIYSRMMDNRNMTAYQQAKDELDKLVKSIVTIITVSAQGEDPDSIEESGCGGSCEGCAGCH
ncbi:MAG: YlbF family regulator [Oscillospiraceae bacterium]|nr:YlbF family regulator [Oscillospiraceae bacterium]MDD4412935.1 YlbF family regulator [Oscillospiraceae bacterium]